MSHSEEPDSLRAWLKFFFEDPPSVFLVLIKGGLRPGTLAWGVVEAIAAWLEGGRVGDFRATVAKRRRPMIVNSRPTG